MASFEYVTRVQVLGRTLEQKHVHAFLVHGGTRIEIHISALSDGEDEEGRMRRFLGSVRIVAR